MCARPRKPPAGYQCAPGKPEPGVGCKCPSGYREKRTGDDVARCVAPPTPNTAAQFVAALKKGDLDAALTLAYRLDIQKNQMELKAVNDAASAWSASVAGQLERLTSRGQCYAIDKLLERADKYVQIIRAMLDKALKALSGNRDDIVDQVTNAIIERRKQLEQPLRAARDACIAVASRDTNDKLIGGAYESHRRELAACLVAAVDGSIKATLVVEAEGHVVDVAIDASWTDLAAETDANKRSETSYNRAGCFQRVIAKWTFAPNAHGFRGVVMIDKP